MTRPPLPLRPRSAARPLVAAAVVGLLLAGCAPDSGATGDDDPAALPDVLLVVIDTLRGDRTTAVNPGVATTPRLAAYFEGGTVFAQAVAPSSWTLPSMAALFAGRPVASSRHAAFARLPALAERFAAAGYATVGLVANPLITADNGFARGFDVLVTAPEYDVATAELADLRAWAGPALVARATALLADVPDDRPLFLYLHLMDPHEPYDPALRYAAPVDEGWSVGPGGLGAPVLAWTDELTLEQGRTIMEVRRGYDGQILQADLALAGWFDELAAARPRPRLVAVTADHGEGLFDHARNPDGTPGKPPLPAAYWDHGEQLHEEALRVPLWLAGPGVPAGRREERMVALHDLGATLLDLAGLEAPHPRLPLGDEQAAPAAVFGTGSRGWFVRTTGHKYVLPFPERLEHEGVGPRLFALDGVRFAPEQADLSVAEPELAAELADLLERWLRQHAPAEDGAAVDAATLRRLRKLGYLR